MRIRIIQVPPGKAPAEVRKAWVGLVLPLASGHDSPIEAEIVGGVLSSRLGGLLGRAWLRLTGRCFRDSIYAVPVCSAVDILEVSSPPAAAWWRKNTPYLLKPGMCFAFSDADCELLPDSRNGNE